ncbi:MAG: thiamine phosphate synthase, partial [Cytophagales bacterium]|nr:thiamine phosphate synthase [Cytophagales bacterium]
MEMIQSQKKAIRGGIYLVIDPSIPAEELFRKLKEVLLEGVAIVQIWDNWEGVIHPSVIIEQICDLCHRYNVPVVINN